MLVHVHGMTAISTWTVVWCVGLASAIKIPDGHSLDDALHHFEVLHTGSITRHTPPHTSSPHSTAETIHLHFRTLDRDFNLILTPTRAVLHNSLHISVVTEKSTETKHFPYPQFYSGHLLGTPDSSSVVAHLHPVAGVLTAAIHTADEVFYVEPSFRHFDEESHDFHMITYKQSHLKLNFTGQPSQHFCGNHGNRTSPRKHAVPWQHGMLHRGEKQRVRRDLAGDVCTLHLVATPSFHNLYSSGDTDMTTLFLINLIHDIDLHIFQETNFTTRRPILGLVVTNITIYTGVTDSTPEYAREEERNSETVLELFSMDDWSGVCLAHLFTAESFNDNRLGVAYVASRNRDDTGGICSPLVKGSGGRSGTANVGVSSFRNSDNRFLLLAEARLVTTHEIGHGWGSEHDPPNDPDCSPPVKRNQGKYLMFPSATDGDQRNNDMFSPCSVAMMSDVAESKGTCFQERSQLVGQCGDYRVQEGEEGEEEECDAGALGKVGSDSCCTRDCLLRETTPDSGQVECSDVNDGCCENCQVVSADAGQVCQTNRPGNAQCLRSVYCMGEKECPLSSNLIFELRYVDEMTQCGQEGRCLPPETECNMDGNCTSPDEPDKLECFNFCQWHDMEECFCSGSDECRFCCSEESGNATCDPFRDHLRPTRSSCVGGYCDNGECIPSSQDLIQRLFVLFDDPSIDTFVQFMRENIVGTVVFLTALLWIPAAFLIHIYDGYRWREHKRMARELEADREDAEFEDEDDVFEEMEASQPGVLRPEAKLALMRLDSGTICDYFDDEPATPLTPLIPAAAPTTAQSHSPYSGLWENRLSTITEESSSGLNPERDNILAHVSQRTAASAADGGGHYLKHSSLDTAP